MAIQPLQLPGPLVVPTPDWSALDKIGDVAGKYFENQRLAEAFRGANEQAAMDAAENAKRSAGAMPTTPSAPQAPSGSSPSYPRIPGYEPSTAAAGPSGGQLPRGLRNNNPGNIEDGALAKSLPGYAGSDGRFAKFDTPENGLGAMDALLTSYGRRGLKTVGEVTGRWAPKSDNNDPDAYARFVSPNGDPNAAVDLSDPTQRKQMVGRMSLYENGMHGGPPGGNGAAANGVPPAPSQAQMAEAAGVMSPEQIKRVQALYAAGPNARALANSIIGKYVGKQEYGFQTLPDGTVVRTNPTTGTVEPVYTAHGTVDVKTPGPFGTTNTTTMQRDANGNLRPLQVTGAGAPATATSSVDEGLTGEQYLKT